MKMLATRGLFSAVFLIALSAAAHAASLTLDSASAPAINCDFNTNCTVTVTDHVSDIPMPNQITGKARLQSRTDTGAPGSPAAGKTGYQYRVDMTEAVALGEFACVTDLEVDFGPVSKLQYNASGPLDDVFVVTRGDLGKIGLMSATETNNIITFGFSPAGLCGRRPGQGRHQLLLRPRLDACAEIGHRAWRSRPVAVGHSPCRRRRKPRDRKTIAPGSAQFAVAPTKQ